MYNEERLSHTTWDCKYHLIWIPKYRKKLIYGELPKYVGEVIREVSIQIFAHSSTGKPVVFCEGE